MLSRNEWNARETRRPPDTSQECAYNEGIEAKVKESSEHDYRARVYAGKVYLMIETDKLAVSTCHGTRCFPRLHETR
jgi:hypothetical protein